MWQNTEWTFICPTEAKEWTCLQLTQHDTKLQHLPVACALHLIFLHVWRSGHIQEERRDSNIVTLYKGKGPKTDSPAATTDTLHFSVPDKVFAYVLSHIQPLIDTSCLIPQQSGFRSINN